MNSKLLFRSILGALIAMGCVIHNPQAAASIVSPIQSTAHPLGLSTAGPVYVGGSDYGSQQFLTQLPTILSTLNTLLPEYQKHYNLGSLAYNPASLLLSENANVRIYFIKEGASYRSSLGLNVLTELPAVNTPVITSDAELIFPNVSSSAPGNYNYTGNSIRTKNEPLLPGDYVDLGQISAGSVLDFFLIPDGANSGTVAIAGEASRNPDNLQHLVTFTVPGSNYIFLSFEDAINGGDRDYNDAVFAIEITYTPEPGTWAAVGALGLYVGYGLVRRKKKTVHQAA